MPLHESVDSILQLRGFGAAFGEKITLNGIDLDIAEKNITILLGPGGTGKSTLLRSIAGLNDTNPSFRTWGDAEFSGAPLGPHNRPSLVSQSAKLMVRSVLENIVHNLPERNNLTQLQQKDLAVRLLEQAGLNELKDSLQENVVTLPLALQRRIAILRLSSAAPRLLCLDEPTTGISEAETEQLLQHVHNESSRRAILIVLHNQNQTRQLGGYSALLAGGHIKEHKPTLEFFNNPETESTRQFVRSGSCYAPAPDARPEDLDDNIAPPPAIPRAVRKYVSESFGPRGFLWLLKGRLAGTPLPGVFFDLAYDLKALQRVGITCLISTTQAPVPEKELQQYGIQGKAFPILDMGVPTLEQAVEICRYIDTMLDAGENIAVHCRAGLGRTGTVLALYLIWQHADALDALEKIRNIEPRWVQSDEQIEFLDEFSDYTMNNESLSKGSTNHHDSEISNAI